MLSEPLMRSLRYIVGGRPHTLDDCLDLTRRNRPVHVNLRLSTDELVTEMFVRRDLIGDYDWEFPQGWCRCHEWYGSVSLLDPEPRRRVEFNRANQKLQRRLRELRETGLEVNGRDSRFGGSLLPA